MIPDVGSGALRLFFYSSDCICIVIADHVLAARGCLLLAFNDLYWTLMASSNRHLDSLLISASRSLSCQGRSFLPKRALAGSLRLFVCGGQKELRPCKIPESTKDEKLYILCIVHRMIPERLYPKIESKISLEKTLYCRWAGTFFFSFLSGYARLSVLPCLQSIVRLLERVVDIHLRICRCTQRTCAGQGHSDVLTYYGVFILSTGLYL